MAIVYPNLDFELELARPGHQLTLPTRLRQMVPYALALGGPGDIFLSPFDFSPPPALDTAQLPTILTLEALEKRGDAPAFGPFRPWGWSPSARRVAERLGLGVRAPDDAILREVNSKVYSVALEARLGIQPAGVKVVGDLDALRRACADLVEVGQDWLLKDPLGFGGQGRLLGRGAFGSHGERWAVKHLKKGPVVVEPHLARRGEYSVQLEVQRGGKVDILGILGMIDTKGGRYRGNRLGPGAVPAHHQGPLKDTGMKVGQALHASGYFGYAGIDAFEYVDMAGQSRLRPLVEINARHTFGTVALAWQRFLPDGETGYCLIVPRSKAKGEAVLPITPFELDGKPAHRVACLSAADIPEG